MSNKKDPGALAGATGADQDAAEQQRVGQNTKPDRSARAATKKSKPKGSPRNSGFGKQPSSQPAPELTQANILLTIAEEASLFHTPDGIAYADLTIDRHRETWPVRGATFKHWLLRQYFKLRAAAPNKDAIQSALATIEARAHFDSPERLVYRRVAEEGGKLYLDLADNGWRAVEIDADGWRIVSEPPVRFQRSSGMLPLPEPVKGGSLRKLREFLNVSTEADFVLVVAWLLAALRPRGPYPLLVLTGEQGSAKSMTERLLRNIIDPHKPELSSLPREERDLFISADHRHIAAFDNISTLRPWISDALCRLSTGGGFTTRTLYSNDDETSFDITKPVILNGIDDFVIRGDLADRSIILLLEPLADSERRTERELLQGFNDVHPAILGAILDAAAHGLRELPNVQVEKTRMADFVVWATACEGGFLKRGTFKAAYDANRTEATGTLIEGDIVATAVRNLTAKCNRPWSGTATELMKKLLLHQPADVSRMRVWPRTARALSSRLRRAAPMLRRIGIDVDFNREGHQRDRIITLSLRDFASAQSSSPAAAERPVLVRTKRPIRRGRKGGRSELGQRPREVLGRPGRGPSGRCGRKNPPPSEGD